MITTSQLKPEYAMLLLGILSLASLCTSVSAGAVTDPAKMQLMGDQFVSAEMLSDEDRSLMQQVKNQIDDQFSSFKNVEDVHRFLEKVRLLAQKHPRNTAFAQGDVKDLHKLLSQEIITRLIRLDTTPFDMPVNEVRAQRAVDEDELTGKLFGGPLRSLVEARKQEHRQQNDQNHRDGNFFSNFFCKLMNNCSN